MNDEASSSAQQPLDAPAPAFPHSHTSAHDAADRSDLPAPAALTPKELEEKRRKNRQLFNRKRGDLLDDLLRNLDILVYAELSTIYYMDCSFTRFLLRAFPHFLFLTPKPPSLFPQHHHQHPEDRPIVSAIFGTFLFCVFCHLWFDAPSAGEATRGYLHGGLVMDFIGQKEGGSDGWWGSAGRKGWLVGLDLVVGGLQVVLLAAGEVRRRLRRMVEENETAAVDRSTSTRTTATATATTTNVQDLDSEERGVRREEEEHDIEMQTLNPSSTMPDSSTTPTTTATLHTDTTLNEPSSSFSSSHSDHSSWSTRTDAHIFDAFHSGQIVLADLDLWKRVQEQARIVKNPSSSGSRHAQPSFRSELAARMLRLRMGTDALRESL